MSQVCDEALKAYHGAIGHTPSCGPGRCHSLDWSGNSRTAHLYLYRKEL